MRRTILACVVTALVVGGGTATAQKLITSRDIKDGTIKSADIKNGTIKNDDIKKSTITRGDLEKKVRRLLEEGGSGPAGPTGPKGEKGDKGDPGPRLSSGNWGVQNRNTIGSPGAFLRSGPFNPPNGSGSLNLVVAGGAPATPIGQLEKAAYGNEIDFTGNLVQNLNAVGFRVFTTGENTANVGGGGAAPNMPSITIEVDPNRETSTSGFSSLVFLPGANSTANQWSGYIDATASGGWFGTGAAFTGSPCILATPCPFDTLKTYLADGGEPATIFTVGITKGRDFSWQGAVDGLRINNTVYDFEETGVFERAP